MRRVFKLMVPLFRMVNPDIVNFLKEGKIRGFSINLLKQKLLEGGFSEKDVTEAVDFVEGIKQPTNTSLGLGSFGQPQPIGQVVNSGASLGGFGQQKVINPQNQNEKNISRGVSWMKIGGWCGVLLLILGFSFSLAGSFFPNVFQNTLVFGIMALILAGLTFFYYFGFVKLGRSCDSKLLRIASIMILTMLILGIVGAVVLFFAVASLTASLINGGSSSGGMMIMILYIIFGLIALLFIVSQILFAIGLIKAGKKVRFAKAAGVLEIIFFILEVLLVIGSIAFALSSITQIMQSFVIGPSEDVLQTIASVGVILMVLFFGFLATALLKLVTFILEILALFNGSKNFEN
jgi:hypothetical protein